MTQPPNKNEVEKILEELDKEIMKLLKFLDRDTAFYRNRPVEEFEHYPYPELDSIHSVLKQAYTLGKKDGARLVIEEITNWKIIEYPKMKKVSCEQAFIGGQMNMLMRIPDLKAKYLTNN